MSYSLFLLIFVTAPAALLALALRRQLTRGYWAAIALVIFIAVLYTTPWDNFLVASGIWYYDPRLVLNVTLGWVPIEEYAFFVVQVIFAGLLLRLVLHWLRAPSATAQPAGDAEAPAPGLRTTE